MIKLNVFDWAADHPVVAVCMIAFGSLGLLMLRWNWIAPVDNSADRVGSDI